MAVGLIGIIGAVIRMGDAIWVMGRSLGISDGTEGATGGGNTDSVDATGVGTDGATGVGVGGNVGHCAE